MMRRLALAIVAVLTATPALALDPLIARMEPLAFEQGGACYLDEFNAQYGSGLTAEKIVADLMALPVAERGAIKYDSLLLAAEMAVGQRCAAGATPAPQTADSRLGDVFRSGMSACDLRAVYSPRQAVDLIAILDRTSDQALQAARIDRGGLRVLLQQIASFECAADAGTDTATPTPTPTPRPNPTPPQTPEVKTVDWRNLPQGAPITRDRNFDIPLADLLIDGRYIALFADGVGPLNAATVANLTGLSTGAVIDVMPNLGAAVLAVPEADIPRIAALPAVAGFTQDRLGFFNQSRPANSAAQDLADQVTTGLDDRFTPLTENRRVRVYVVDGGIRADHAEVAGRVTHWRAIGDHHGGLNRHLCERHGTAVASVIGGAQLGIAQSVDLIDVDITPCDGQDPTAFPASHILLALDWIDQTQTFLPGRNMPTVINLSLGVPAGDDAAFVREGNGFWDPGLFGLDAFEAKMRQFLTRHPNVTIVAAAGNEGANACHYFPARMADVITVGGSTLSDTLWGNSNFGPCVDTFALAERVAVADAGLGADGMSQVDGTSFATAIVSGVIAHRLAAGQNIAEIRRDILRPVTMDRTLQADLARGTAPADGALSGNLQFLAKIPSPFRADCVVDSYDGTLNMRSGPSLDNGVIRALTNGEGLSLQGQSGDKWLLVRLRDGQEGWVARADRHATLVRNTGQGADCTQ